MKNQRRLFKKPLIYVLRLFQMSNLFPGLEGLYWNVKTDLPSTVTLPKHCSSLHSCQQEAAKPLATGSRRQWSWAQHHRVGRTEGLCSNVFCRVLRRCLQKLYSLHSTIVLRVTAILLLLAKEIRSISKKLPLLAGQISDLSNLPAAIQSFMLGPYVKKWWMRVLYFMECKGLGGWVLLPPETFAGTATERVTDHAYAINLPCLAAATSSNLCYLGKVAS